MKFEDLICPECIKILSGKRKDEVLSELVDLLVELYNLNDGNRLREAIFHREKLMSTGIGLGIAIPHIRIEGVKEPLIAIAVCRDGIPDYESIDNQTVKIVIMIIAGKEQHKEYITLLSQIVSKLKKDDVREKILSAENPEEILQVIRM